MTRDDALRALADARAAGRPAIDEPAAKRVVAAFGIAVPDGEVVADADGATAALARIGGPVAVKLVSPQPIHKSDIGGVALGLTDAASVREAADALRRRAADARVDATGLLVERMAAPGVEVVVGALRDARFGPVVMLGLGGVFIEVFADVAFRVCPIGEADARSMIDGLRAAPLLRGARGRPPVDEAALVAVLLAVGGPEGLMMRAGGAIAELDLNPVMAGPRGATACDARILLRAADAPSDAPSERRAPGEPADLVERFRPLLEPRAIAVAGASATAFTPANDFIRQCVALGYRGRIVPIHPKAAEVEGLPAVASFAALDAPVDYTYVSVAAAQVPALVASARGRTRFLQVVSSGFGEVGDGVALERELARAGRDAGIRLLGPNCLGVYSPRAGLAFVGDCPAEPGPIGLVSQSGGLAVDMLLRGSSRGLRFSGLVTLGNSVDLGPADLVEYYVADPGTRAIGVYVEDVREGRRFFDVLVAAAGRKPVVVLLGGQTDAGRQAAASHTGSLAGSASIWAGLAAQTGLTITDTLEQFLDVLLAFQTLRPRADRPTRRCVLFGNGGGTSVLAADAFARRGLQVAPMGRAAIGALEALKLPPGTSVVNPIDAPAFTLKQDDGRIAEAILDAVYRHESPDAVVVHLNLPVFVKSADQRADFLGNLVAAALRAGERHPGVAHFALALRSDGSAVCDERKRAFRETAVRAGIPVFDELSNAADALAAVAAHERFVSARGGRPTAA